MELSHLKMDAEAFKKIQNVSTIISIGNPLIFPDPDARAAYDWEEAKRLIMAFYGKNLQNKTKYVFCYAPKPENDQYQDANPKLSMRDIRAASFSNIKGLFDTCKHLIRVFDDTAFQKTTCVILENWQVFKKFTLFPFVLFLTCLRIFMKRNCYTFNDFPYYEKYFKLHPDHDENEIDDNILKQHATGMDLADKLLNKKKRLPSKEKVYVRKKKKKTKKKKISMILTDDDLFDLFQEYEHLKATITDKNSKFKDYIGSPGMLINLKAEHVKFYSAASMVKLYLETKLSPVVIGMAMMHKSSSKAFEEIENLTINENLNSVHKEKVFENLTILKNRMEHMSSCITDFAKQNRIDAILNNRRSILINYPALQIFGMEDAIRAERTGQHIPALGPALPEASFVREKENPMIIEEETVVNPETQNPNPGQSVILENQNPRPPFPENQNPHPLFPENINLNNQNLAIPVVSANPNQTTANPENQSGLNVVTQHPENNEDFSLAVIKSNQSIASGMEIDETYKLIQYTKEADAIDVKIMKELKGVIEHVTKIKNDAVVKSLNVDNTVAPYFSLLPSIIEIQKRLLKYGDESRKLREKFLKKLKKNLET